ncbi:SDR family oxidoreductase [Gordonia pseudamarae]|jgi:NAD(P)-dependent dehydrogenase (short-subunit alcohol dehydrogenase family)|uniref:SDR family oxidoreductase n=1 Tax=Gordonia pseudamarae TaxID=2831662 RepID=A0ABX6IM09_9ACTN|nr:MULTISPECIES: SDR family oxidoreductase [Gordonia]MBD0021853.1 SDR family oxidoreductase [Gordonia sp. (in: high G+C Gram-positive bacteria)]QHN27967.1 SDR family oxidoreductase [Gordonia pseudamarae]QHN36825.1 SDR family oxidoreductase [Gordonia pseudamarae]
MSAVLDLFRLDGRVAVVTGASSGLGVSFAGALADAGADLVLAARRIDRLEETKKVVEAKGRRAITVACDVADPQACADVATAAVENFGRLDILVNNAGISDAVPAAKETADEFDRVVTINLNGTFYMAQACARAMTDGGSIINIASVLGLTSIMMPHAAYASSKAGVIGLTRELAQQWSGRKGIRVNAIAPGYFASEMTSGLIDGGYADKFVIPRTLFGRLGNEGELNPALIFLASDASSYVTGITLPVDGGILTN